MPAGGKPIALNVSVDNPTLFFTRALRAALIAGGIDVQGPAADLDDLGHDAPDPRSAAPIATFRSPPLSTLAVRLMKISQNLYAETLLETLSGTTPATAAGGRAVVQSVLTAWGLADGDVIQRDGSGLTRYDFVTAEALVAILTHVDRDPRLREPFEASLPIAGRDGTLAKRMKGTPAEGNVRAKTGSMTGVRGTSGSDDRRRRAARLRHPREQLRGARQRRHKNRRRHRRPPGRVQALRLRGVFVALLGLQRQQRIDPRRSQRDGGGNHERNRAEARTPT